MKKEKLRGFHWAQIRPPPFYNVKHAHCFTSPAPPPPMSRYSNSNVAADFSHTLHHSCVSHTGNWLVINKLVFLVFIINGFLFVSFVLQLQLQHAPTSPLPLCFIHAPFLSPPIIFQPHFSLQLSCLGNFISASIQVSNPRSGDFCFLLFFFLLDCDRQLKCWLLKYRSRLATWAFNQGFG